ncbi:MAG: hypothetical protein ACFE7E_07515 [Candidatus Hodarchaeota archaeon]
MRKQYISEVQCLKLARTGLIISANPVPSLIEEKDCQEQRILASEWWILSISLILIVISVAGILHQWWKTRDVGHLYGFTVFAFFVVALIGGLLGSFTILWFFLVTALIIAIMGISEAVRIDSKYWARFIRETEEEPITGKDFITGRLTLKLAKKYGLGKTMVLLSLIIGPVTFLVSLIVYAVFLGLTPSEAFTTTILGTVMATTIVIAVVYYSLSSVAKQTDDILE